MAARNFLSRCIALELQIFNDSMGFLLKNTVHLGKKLLVAIFSTITYRQLHEAGGEEFSTEMHCVLQLNSYRTVKDL